MEFGFGIAGSAGRWAECFGQVFRLAADAGRRRFLAAFGVFGDGFLSDGLQGGDGGQVGLGGGDYPVPLDVVGVLVAAVVFDEQRFVVGRRPGRRLSSAEQAEPALGRQGVGLGRVLVEEQRALAVGAGRMVQGGLDGGDSWAAAVDAWAGNCR